MQEWISLLMVFGVVTSNVPSFDVRAFIPDAPSNRHPCCYRKDELEKNCHYNSEWERLNTLPFTPLVLSATGGMVNEATVFYKRLASRLATKWDQPYSTTMSWLRCRLTFSLFQSAIQCITDALTSCGYAAKLQTPPIDLVVSVLDFVQFPSIFKLGLA